MKYCNRCFRNIVEDVAVCPYCGRADKLIDYDKQKRGEDFTCSSNSTLSSHLRKDAYSIDENDGKDAYGNSKRHDLDNCENGEQGYDASVDQTVDNFEYLKSLPVEQRRRLYEQKMVELRQRLAQGNMNTAGGKVDMNVTINGRKVNLNDLRRSLPDEGYRPVQQPDIPKKTGTVATVLLLLAVFFPILIPVIIIGLVVYFGNKNKEQ